MNEPRSRAAALLDVLGYRSDQDRTAEARADARRYRAACASGRFPARELEWAWADNLDTQLHHAGERSVFGALAAWWPEGTDRPPGTLALAGRTGPGKTVGAVWLASRRGGAFMVAAELGELELAAEGKLRHLITTPLLVIDDIGDEATTGPTLDRVRRVLKDRHGANRTTLLTTNLPAPHFAARYGDHVLDRIESTGSYVHLRGRSRRHQGERPVLDGIARACRITDLVDAVDSMTGTRGRAPQLEIIRELQALFDVPEQALELARARRLTWSVEQRSPR